MSVQFRAAVRADVPAIIALLADDDLGRLREIGDMADYEAAFDRIAAEPGNGVFVGEDDGRVVATYQLTIISNLSLGASSRAQIEAVRVAAALRGQGIGAALMADAEARARAKGARLFQFTSNKVRDRAHGFYRRCGFEATHEGFKKVLD